jgi:hypothetical protein
MRRLRPRYQLYSLGEGLACDRPGGDPVNILPLPLRTIGTKVPRKSNERNRKRL